MGVGAWIRGKSMRTDEDLSYDVLRSIRRILRRVSENSRLLARVAGLTVPQLFCLKAIGEGDGTDEMSVASVSRKVHLSAATVSRILDRLEHAGLVIRERRSRDRRKVCLSLTDGGRERLSSLPLSLQDTFLEKLQALDRKEREDLLQSLERVVELLEASDIDASPMLTPGIDVKDPTLGN